ncbi:hypothetical protein Hanom_Chr11g00973051 [Helianthus anomalus]
MFIDICFLICFWAEPDTDEVFAQITLIPVSDVSIMGLMVKM